MFVYPIELEAAISKGHSQSPTMKTRQGEEKDMAREPQQYTQQGSLQDSSPPGMEQGCGVYRASLFRDMPGLGVTVGKARGKSQLK